MAGRHVRKWVGSLLCFSCSDVACAFTAVVPFMVAGKADNADVGWFKAQVLPAPLADDVVEVMRPWFAYRYTAQLAEMRALCPYLREEFTLTRIAGLAGLYGFGDGVHGFLNTSTFW